ncbi:hypothetical protein H0H92_003051 [Tricholoma furcatifolium]|nr:hypothetical protein H0H92_003051 [Tricholoma furcatifolium]
MPPLRCHDPSCPRTFKSVHGQTNHFRTTHINSNQRILRPAPPVNENNLWNRSPSPFQLDQPATPPLPDPPPLPHGHNLSPPRIRASKTLHQGLTAAPCDQAGNFVDPKIPPPPRTAPKNDDWSPYQNSTQFKMADFLYRRVQMSASNIDHLFEIWSLFMSKYDDSSPFTSHDDMYRTIDATRFGDAPWQCFSITYDGDTSDDAFWKSVEYEVWYRDPDTVISNMLDNPDFDGQFDYVPYVRRDQTGQRTWSDFMSSNYAWKHADLIMDEDEENEGAMYCPIILGSDKTTVSVATGHVEYYPLYLSIGNVHNTVRRAHRNAVVPIGFLAIPKSDRQSDKNPEFRKFKQQLYHASLSTILQSLRPGMTKPVVRRCPDAHYRRVIYDFAAYIADYPEQVLLGGIVQNWCPKGTSLPDNLDGPEGRRTRELTQHLMDTWGPKELWDNYGINASVIPFTFDFPRADIYEMLSPDILHQLIKGTFKDHLVEWVGTSLVILHGETQAKEILDDIDRRIAAVPAFPGLRRFPHGHRFKQWTGDDSKALMKIYLCAITGHVPSEMVQCISAFIDACYICRRDDLSEASIKQLENSITRFHTLREIFRTIGTRPTGFSLPRQHALSHYPNQIRQFGAPNGLCSSITESRHITAVKKPWRRSNRYDALGQMLVTNQRLDKLAASRSDFVSRNMLPADHSDPPTAFAPDVIHDGNGQDEGAAIDDEYVTGNVVLARKPEPSKIYPRNISHLSIATRQHRLEDLIRRFLFDQINDDPTLSANTVSLEACPWFAGNVYVYHSAIATFYAPSDDSGIRGMRRERIRSTPDWRGRGSRRDCAFVVQDDKQPGMKGLAVVRVRLFFSLEHDNTRYPCALVEWFKTVGRSPDLDTGMWKVRPDMVDGQREILDAFDIFYVNKFADHHAHEICY